MAITVVRFGTPRQPGEGPRLGTVRRPPRGVPKEEYAARDYYDVWFPNLAPSAETMKLGLQSQREHDDRALARFERAYRKEMAAPDASRTLDVLATLSHHADFAVGCYCEDESRCHRRILRELLTERGAAVN